MPGRAAGPDGVQSGRGGRFWQQAGEGRYPGGDSAVPQEAQADGLPGPHAQPHLLHQVQAGIQLLHRAGRNLPPATRLRGPASRGNVYTDTNVL